MKNDIYGKIKARKPFEINDFFIYLSLFVLVALLFLFFIILPNSQDAKGFTFLLNDKEIFSFYYDSEEFSVLEEYKDFIQVDKINDTVTIYYDKDKTDFNLMSYSAQKRGVVMIDSTCSKSKDCTFEPAIYSSGTIYCAPHGLIVLPIGGNANTTPPVIGGGL